MAKLILDDIEVAVPDHLVGENLLSVILTLKKDLPYFCWHPALGSVGACRQCAVTQYRDADDDTGKLVMACMTPFRDGLRVRMSDIESKEFRESVIGWLMTNHPHDCPICDEGGECHLQDMTVQTGHNYREYRFEKRSHRNQDLGPFVKHEMNRCIACYRCVRFYRDYADGRDLHAFASRNNVYFGRHEDGTLESEFSGNLVEVCPTGVFTDKPLSRNYTRKWDLQSAPAICLHCGHGCNIIAGERYGEVRRILSRFNDEVNGYFICDRGRFGYEYVNSDKRLRAIWTRRSSEAAAVSITMAEARSEIRRISREPGPLVGIGSPRASLEANYALRKLVGEENFYQGIPEVDTATASLVASILRDPPAKIPTLPEIEEADAVLVLGEDVSATAPRLSLALRQASRRAPAREAAERLKIGLWHDTAIRDALQERRSDLIVCALHATALDEIASQVVHKSAEDLARLGFAIANALDVNAPEPAGMLGEEKALAGVIASVLARAKRPLVVSGCGSGSTAVIQAASNVARALNTRPGAALRLVAPEANSVGLGLLAGPGMGLDRLEGISSREPIGTLIILENELASRLGPERAEALYRTARTLVVIDSLSESAVPKANLILPAATFAEGDGTYISSEARAQRSFQVYPPSEPVITESWRWLREWLIAKGVLKAGDWKNLDEVLKSLEEEVVSLAGIARAAPDAGFRMHGQRIPRASHRFSGRAALSAHRDVREPRPPEDVDSPLSFSMEGAEGQAPAALVPRIWAPGWNSSHAITKFQAEVNGPLYGGPAGVRLFEKEAAVAYAASYFPPRIEAFVPASGDLRVVRMHHVFGSELLSSYSSGVIERSPIPYIAFHPRDLERLGYKPDDDLLIRGVSYPIRAVTNASLERGTVGLPTGLKGLWPLAAKPWLSARDIQRYSPVAAEPGVSEPRRRAEDKQ